MSEAFSPLDAAGTIAAARRIFDRADSALTIRRGLERIPDRELLSIVIFVLQLDEIAQAAALAAIRNDLFTRSRLQELLVVPGYLPLPHTQEPPHGQK